MPVQTDMVPVKNLENGHLGNKLSHEPVVPPTVRFPIRVEDLDEYLSSRRPNDCEELRKEYRVSDSMFSNMCFFHEVFVYLFQLHLTINLETGENLIV